MLECISRRRKVITQIHCTNWTFKYIFILDQKGSLEKQNYSNMHQFLSYWRKKMFSWYGVHYSRNVSVNILKHFEKWKTVPIRFIPQVGILHIKLNLEYAYRFAYDVILTITISKEGSHIQSFFHRPKSKILREMLSFVPSFFAWVYFESLNNTGSPNQIILTNFVPIQFLTYSLMQIRANSYGQCCFLFSFKQSLQDFSSLCIKHRDKSVIHTF